MNIHRDESLGEQSPMFTEPEVHNCFEKFSELNIKNYKILD